MNCFLHYDYIVNSTLTWEEGALIGTNETFEERVNPVNDNFGNRFIGCIT